MMQNLSNEQYRIAIQGVITHNPEMFDGLKSEHLAAFLSWWPQNIHVIRAFGRRAMELVEKGNRKRYSAYTIREVLRWDSWVSEVGTEYKLSNNMTPFVARLLMKMNSKLDGLFVTKEHE